MDGWMLTDGRGQVLGVPPLAPDADGAAARAGGVQESRCCEEGRGGEKGAVIALEPR